jgi:hypothetical protein
MPEIKGAFRVTKNAFVNTHYTVLLLSDALAFIKTGSELTGHDTHSIKESDLERLNGLSKEELLVLNPKNFIINYDEIINISLKKSSFGINGARTGEMTIQGKTITKFEISPNQNFEAILRRIQTILPGKLDPTSYMRTVRPLSNSSTDDEVKVEEINRSKTADLEVSTETSHSERSIRNGAWWLFVIAALSAINFLIFVLGGDLSFVIGLAFTQYAAAFAQLYGGNVTILAVIVSLIVTAIFLVCGIYARKGKVWAFIMAIVVYVLDTCLFILIQEWYSIAFHVFALIFIFMGMIASYKIRKNNLI